VNQTDPNFNFFFYKEGKNYKRRIDPVNFIEFKNSFMSIEGYCGKEEDIDISKLSLIFHSYISKFDSNSFPLYKKSKLHQALSFCNINSKLEFYLDRAYSYESATRELNLRQNTVSLESFVRRFGQDEGLKRYDSYVEKWKNSIKKHDKKELYKNWKNIPENYLNKINQKTGNFFSLEEAEIKIKEDLSKGFKKVWREYREGKRERAFVNTTLEYYESKGLTTEEAFFALKERQATFTLEKCIHKYGLEEGIRRFKERNEKWQKTLNSKTDEEKKIIMLSKTRNLCRYSRESMVFFESLLNDDGLKFLQNYDVNYGNKEMVLWNHVDKRPYFYDLSIPALKIIIEYNGSTFHPDISRLNEKELTDWKCPLTKLTGPEKYKKDKEKNDFAKSLGYDLVVVWDHEEFDYKSKKCKELIKRKHDDKKSND
jgi:hypothetical protein